MQIIDLFSGPGSTPTGEVSVVPIISLFSGTGSTPDPIRISIQWRPSTGFPVNTLVFQAVDRLRVDWLNGLGEVPREQKILKGHLPRVVYHQIYLQTKEESFR